MEEVEALIEAQRLAEGGELMDTEDEVKGGEFMCGVEGSEEVEMAVVGHWEDREEQEAEAPWSR